MKKISLDASAWIEYFEGTKKGAVVVEIVESPECELFTPMSVVAEVIKFYLHINKDPEPLLEAMQQLSFLVPLTMESSVDAARLYVAHRSKKNSFGLLDAFVLATAREVGAKIVTFDNDFRPFKEAMIL